MSVLKRASVRCVVGGSMAPGKGGWSTVHNDAPPPGPIREVTLHIELKFEDSGYLVICTSDDPQIWCDNWYGSQEEAETAAADVYGVRPEDWKAA
jgi:hypothetical protein